MCHLWIGPVFFNTQTLSNVNRTVSTKIEVSLSGGRCMTVCQQNCTMPWGKPLPYGKTIFLKKYLFCISKNMASMVEQLWICRCFLFTRPRRTSRPLTRRCSSRRPTSCWCPTSPGSVRCWSSALQLGKCIGDLSSLLLKTYTKNLYLVS